MLSLRSSMKNGLWDTQSCVGTRTFIYKNLRRFLRNYGCAGVIGPFFASFFFYRACFSQRAIRWSPGLETRKHLKKSALPYLNALRAKFRREKLERDSRGRSKDFKGIA